MVAQIKSYKLGKAGEIDLSAGRVGWPEIPTVEGHAGNPPASRGSEASTGGLSRTIMESLRNDPNWTQRTIRFFPTAQFYEILFGFVNPKKIIIILHWKCF